MSAIKRYIALVAIAAVSAAAVAPLAGAATHRKTNIVQTAAAAGQFKTLLKLAKQALKADGRIDVGAVLGGIARAPSQITTLIRAGGDAGKAFAGLRRCRRLVDFSLCFGFADL